MTYANFDQKDIYCGTPKLSRCPIGQTCVKPAPNVRCASDKIATCPGVCKPRCVVSEDIDSNTLCPYRQSCMKAPYSTEKSRLGFCPEPTFCGGFAAIKCEGADEICIDDPRDDCSPDTGGADCGGICVSKSTQTGSQCGAKTGKTCPKGYECVENTSDDCDPKKGFRDCPGICIRKTTHQPTDQFCGGIYAKSCPKGYTCFDDPKDGCDSKKGGADCSGLCVKKAICATLSGIQCPEGQKCVDDDDGDCKGGIAADCPGVCVQS